MSSASYDWIYAAVGYPIALLAVLWLLWALFRDRSRGRRRCPKCWYDLAGVPGLTCPECGRTARSEKRFYKTRRRYRRAAIALVLLLAGACITLVPAYQRGWYAIVPSWILVRIAEPRASAASPRPRSLVFQALTAPSSNGSLTGVFAVPSSGVTMGTPAATAGAAPPVNTAESLVREAWNRFTSGDLSPAQARCWLERCMSDAGVQLENCVTVPGAWPQHVPLAASVNILPFPGSDLVEFRFRAPDLDSDWLAFAAGRAPVAGHAGIVRLPASPKPLTHVRIQVRAIGSPSALSAWAASGALGSTSVPVLAGAVLYSRELLLPIRIRGTKLDFIDLVSGPEADVLVREALDPRITEVDGYLRFTWDNTSADPRWSRINFGVYFTPELLVGDRVVGRALGNAFWGDPFWRPWEDTPIAWNAEDRALFRSALNGAPGAPPAHIVLRADPIRAADAYLFNPFNKPRPACWTGVIDLPARLTPRPDAPSSSPVPP